MEWLQHTRFKKLHSRRSTALPLPLQPRDNEDDARETHTVTTLQMVRLPQHTTRRHTRTDDASDLPQARSRLLRFLRPAGERRHSAAAAQREEDTKGLHSDTEASQQMRLLRSRRTQHQQTSEVHRQRRQHQMGHSQEPTAVSAAYITEARHISANASTAGKTAASIFTTNYFTTRSLKRRLMKQSRQHGHPESHEPT